ncbi:MAG TPA: copper homeostasis protein CutC [Vicinamibacterales bacterium]|nr:copper homeostasis protein CutC [Vicinamibacterales bacterium]
MNRLLLEVIVQTVDDARAAADGGADRLEVVRAIGDGGLTPPLDLVRAIARDVSLPLRVMVRENAGYATDAAELPALRAACRALNDAGVDGIVIGFAERGRVRMDDVARVIADTPAIRATFHRAFDALTDPLRALDEIAAVPQIDRVLTSGGAGTADERAVTLARFVNRAKDRLTIIAGGNVDAHALAAFARARCVTEVHVGRAARLRADANGPVSAPLVRRLRAICDGSP